MCDLVALLDSCGVYLTENEYEQCLRLAKNFLDTYHSLHMWAFEKGRLLFYVVINFHTFWHLIVNAKHLTPRYHWCFKSEDFVGRVAWVGHSVSMGAKSTKLSSAILQKYTFLLHLRLTMDGFGYFAEEIEV